ncbi:hypothetical protein HMPREF1870_01563 [Bacteroidales bacterium KA00344]|nr:hypothetical protein HMPREF1870_01563 [Bacteroidales bacterium KA00344]
MVYKFNKKVFASQSLSRYYFIKSTYVLQREKVILFRSAASCFINLLRR